MAQRNPLSSLPSILRVIADWLFPDLTTNPNQYGQNTPRNADHRQHALTSRDSKLGEHDEDFFLPVRTPRTATMLHEIREYSQEAGLAGTIICNDIFSSETGDDQGFKLARKMNREGKVILLNPQVEQILTRLIDNVIGGYNLWWVADNLFYFGDAFGSIVVKEDMTSVERIMQLPTWDIFRIEDRRGNLRRFEQRRYQMDSDVIKIHPLVCVHWRNRPRGLYGRATTKESYPQFARLRDMEEDIAHASRNIGVNPFVHIMPQGTTDEYEQNYREAIRLARSEGIMTDFFIGGHQGGADVKRVNNADSSLSGLEESKQSLRRQFIARLGIPSYLAGIPDSGAKDIQGHPAIAYARLIAGYRAMVTVGIKQICNLELALNGLNPLEPKNFYAIQWPTLHTSVFGQDKAAEDTNPNKNSNDPKAESGDGDDDKDDEARLYRVGEQIAQGYIKAASARANTF